MITNIQKYSIHDGEGIRTTIFFKGCPLKCSWCHNPETQSFEKDFFHYDQRCVGCGKCGGKYYEDCVNNAWEICGREITAKELFNEVQKDQAFYETSGGGVTLSGGEVLAQDISFIVELLQNLKIRGIEVNIDTCGYVDFSRFEAVLPYTKSFLYDLKLMDADKHKKYTGVDNNLILENLKKLSENKASIWVRIPVIGGVNDTNKNMVETAEFIKSNDINPEHIHLLPYHNTGCSKYQQLGKKYDDSFTTPSKEKLEEYRRIFESHGLTNIYIGG